MFYAVQAGTAIKILTETGVVFTTITLPSGVTIDATRRARIVPFARKVIVTNAPSKNIWIDPADFSCHLLSIVKPPSAPTLANGGAGLLNGDYIYRYTFIRKSGSTVINESAMSDSATITVTNDQVDISDIEVSTDPQVTGRRFYRSAGTGSELFFAFDINDNVATTKTDNVPDAGLDTVAADQGIEPAQGGSDGTSHMTLLTAWKNRLWGRSDVEELVDHILYTQENLMYGWSGDQDFPAYPQGEDRAGITGYAPRRDALGVFKQNRLLKIIGSTEDDFQVLIVVEQLGCVAPDSIVIIRDAAYFLAADGVYRWDDEGVVCLTRESVDPWFTRDDVFNREAFPNAIGAWNDRTNSYELQLTSAGGTTLDRWIAIELSGGQVFGPHFTAALTTTARAMLRGDDAVKRPAFGGDDGFIYLQNQPGAQDIDGEAVSWAISATARCAWLMQGNPDLTHVWGRLSLHSRLETGGTLGIAATVGGLDSTQAAPQSFDLTKGREIKNRLGIGRLCQLVMTQEAIGEQFLVYGLEITPVGTRGRR
jgi:hypothetical protein